MSVPHRLMYHTQERRRERLTAPIICTRDDAWLGTGYYFWNEVDDAERWGRDTKCRTSSGYEVYSATIDCSNVLDTVFNEEHYQFWLKQIDKVAKTIYKNTGKKATIKEINQYFHTRGQWSSVNGILFQDVPTSSTYSLVQSFYYRKRIQIAVYKLEIMTNFAFLSETKC